MPDDNKKSLFPPVDTSAVRNWLDQNAQQGIESNDLAQKFAGGLQKSLVQMLLPQSKEERINTALNMAMFGHGGFPEGAPIYSLKPAQYEQLSAKIVGLPEAGKIEALKAAGYDVAKDYVDYHPNKAFSDAANKAILQKELPLTSNQDIMPGSRRSLANELSNKLKGFEKENEANYIKYSKQNRNEALSPEKAGELESLKNRTSLDSLMGAKGAQEKFTQQDLIDTSKQYRMLQELLKDSPDLLQRLEQGTPDQIKNFGTIIRKPNE